MIPAGYNIISLYEAGLQGPLEETGKTIRENALQKARFAARHTAMPCFADDTGLEVTALGGQPGIHTARYAGPLCSADDNMNKLLAALSGNTNRNAVFRTVIALVTGSDEFVFEGIVKGHIAQSRAGTGGFGYDPVFVPEGCSQTFAQMDASLKNSMSHRGRAMQRFVDFLRG